MEDSCGPSNALKSLHRQIDVDRSLQQSHLRPGSSSQHFRTGPSQDQVNRANQEYDQFLHAGRPEQRFVEQEAPGHARTNLWATDFRQAGPDQVHPPHQAQQVRPHASNWGAEFMAMHHAQSSGTGLHSHPQQVHPGFIQPSFVSHPQHYQAPLPLSTSAAAASAQHITHHDQEAFSAAFNQAEQSLNSIRLDNAADLSFLPHDHHQHLDDQDQSHLPVPESMEEERTRDAVERKMEGDALSQTAGELIYALRDETSEKFKASKFMALMCALRDGQVVVEGEKMIDVGTGLPIKSHQRDGTELQEEAEQIQQ